MKLIQKETAPDNILLLMISAIFSLLSVRLYLQLANFPKIGTGSWHVAHAVFGGFFMIFSSLLSISFYGKTIRKTSSILFGLGMGLFVDEIGKLLSSDNDYLFQPAVSLIYIFFVLIFLFYWYLSRNRPVNSKTHLYRSINKFEEIIEEDLQISEKTDIIENLNQAIRSDDSTFTFLAKQLKLIIQKTDVLTDTKNRSIENFWKKIRSFAYKLFKKKLSLILIIIISLIYSLSSIIDFILLFSDQAINTNSLFWFKTLSDLFVSLLFILAIFVRLAKKASKSLAIFQYGLLVNIFLSQIFKFYFQQFQALIGLSFSIIIYFGLKRLRQEKVI